MKIIKEADIKVRSAIDNLDASGLVDGDSEITESSAVGYLHVLDEVTLLTYVEEQENGARVTTEIKCDGDSVRVLRHGDIESDMMLAVGAPHDSIYAVGPYKFDITVNAKKIRNSLTENGGRLALIYSMEIGGAKKDVRMNIEVSIK